MVQGAQETTRGKGVFSMPTLEMNSLIARTKKEEATKENITIGTFWAEPVDGGE